jgi:hypothetical protein
VTISLTMIGYAVAVFVGTLVLGFGISVVAFWGQEKAFIKGYLIAGILVAIGAVLAGLAHFGFLKFVP